MALLSFRLVKAGVPVDHERLEYSSDPDMARSLSAVLVRGGQDKPWLLYVKRDGEDVLFSDGMGDAGTPCGMRRWLSMAEQRPLIEIDGGRDGPLGSPWEYVTVGDAVRWAKEELLSILIYA